MEEFDDQEHEANAMLNNELTETESEFLKKTEEYLNENWDEIFDVI